MLIRVFQTVSHGDTNGQNSLSLYVHKKELARPNRFGKRVCPPRKSSLSSHLLLTPQIRSNKVIDGVGRNRYRWLSPLPHFARRSVSEQTRFYQLYGHRLCYGTGRAVRRVCFSADFDSAFFYFIRDKMTGLTVICRWLWWVYASVTPVAPAAVSLKEMHTFFTGGGDH